MAKNISYYMNLPYTIEMVSDPDGGWFVAIKELPGCISQGDTPEEAIEMIHDAMRGWIEVSLEDGDSIPEPRSLDEFSGKFVVRVPRSMHQDLVERSDEEGVSLNQYINTALARALGIVLSSAVKPDEDPPGWPGLKAAARQVLVAAGMSEEAGALDERLLADVLALQIKQVEADLQLHCYRDAVYALRYLESLLHIGAAKSPVLEAFSQTIRLLQQQIDTIIQLQRGFVEERALASRVSDLAREKIAANVQQFSRESSAEYARATVEPMRQTSELFEQLLGGSAVKKEEW